MLTKVLAEQRRRERVRWLDEVAEMVEEAFGEGLEIIPIRLGAAVIDEDGNEVAFYDYPEDR